MRIEEKKFIKYIAKKYGELDLLVDVGANIGNYANYFNNQMNIKKTYLFEPIKSCYDKINQRDGYTIFNIGIGSKKDVVEFYECVGKESHSSIVNREWLYGMSEYNIDKKNINIDRLDNLVSEKINILKIDTEGYELEVLKGCSNLLKNKLIDYIQFEYGGCFKDNEIKLNDVIDYLNEFDYRVYSLDGETFNLIKNYTDDYRWVNIYSTHKKI